MISPFAAQLDQINTAEISDQQLFTMRFGRADERLKNSIQKFGILQPLHLWREQKNLCLIDGLARLSFAKELGFRTLPCFVHGRVDLGRQDVFLLCLELNRLSRGFNEVEKALCLEVAGNLFETERIPSFFWETLALKEHTHIVRAYRDVLKLPKFILEKFVAHNIAVSVILNFLHFPREEIESLAEQVFSLPVNQNRLSEILNLLFDISRREKISACDIMEQALRETAQETDVASREQSLRLYLRRLRNPLLTEKEEEFAAKLKSLSISDNIEVTPAAYFEDNFIDMRARLNSAQDIQRLKDLLDKEGFSLLIKD